MLHPPKGPSRFIPTLTEVVVGPQSPDASSLDAPQQPEERQWAGRLGRTAAPLSVSVRAASASPNEGFKVSTTPALHTLAPDFEEYLVHRVMQRVDVGLDQHLRDAIATVLAEQTRSLLPRLREEVESVVRQVVYEAVADELAAGEKNENAKS